MMKERGKGERGKGWEGLGEVMFEVNRPFQLRPGKARR